MQKRACGNFRDWERLARFLCIWRYQNELDGPRDRGNIVKKFVDGFYELGRLRFHGLLSFQLDFRLQKLLLALKTGFVYRDARFFLPNSGAIVFPC
jgi:hypothetical protein